MEIGEWTLKNRGFDKGWWSALGFSLRLLCCVSLLHSSWLTHCERLDDWYFGVVGCEGVIE